MQNNKLLEVLSELRRRCSQKDNEMVERLGISLGEYQLFMASIYVDRLDSASLADRMSVSVSRISRIVDKMVKDGYLTRVHSESDRRSIVLSFTVEGQDVLSKIKQHRNECELRIKSELSLDHQIDLEKSLNYLIEKM